MHQAPTFFGGHYAHYVKWLTLAIILAGSRLAAGQPRQKHPLSAFQ
ncbi:hypothetical protein VPHK348_0030 [Vibrio phage K348]